MPRALADSTVERLEFLPHFERDDPQIQGVIDAVGRELDRVEDQINTMTLGWFPQNADDTYKLLQIWEQMLGLPVNPATQSVAQRRSLVLAHLRKRRADAGVDWQAALTALLGNSWNYQEDIAPYTVRLIIPFGSGSYTAAQVALLARDVTPAHLDLQVIYDGGGGGNFIIGISQIGVGQI